MPQPEILRRCVVCGAGSRPGATFCPQCGNATVGTLGEPAAGAANGQDLAGGLLLDPRLQTRKLDSGEGSEDAESGLVDSESVERRNALKQTLDGLKSALQATLAEKNALLQLGKEDEATKLDSQIEVHKQALETAVRNIMSSVARGADVNVGVGEQSRSRGFYASVTSDAERPKLDSGINAERAPTVPLAALEDGSHVRSGKLRKASSAVLEDYDPSVRFVLIAAALFVLFLVIMLLSKLIT